MAELTLLNRHLSELDPIELEEYCPDPTLWLNGIFFGDCHGDLFMWNKNEITDTESHEMAIYIVLRDLEIHRLAVSFCSFVLDVCMQQGLGGTDGTLGEKARSAKRAAAADLRARRTDHDLGGRGHSAHAGGVVMRGTLTAGRRPLGEPHAPCRRRPSFRSDRGSRPPAARRVARGPWSHRRRACKPPRGATGPGRSR